MAVSKIRSIHANKGMSIYDRLRESIDYIKDPEKTNSGDLVTSYQCSASIADAEFLFAKAQYEPNTGRTQRSNVLAYHIIQSFAPGDITPEKANELGQELAMRFTKGNHAFIVATHVDHDHIHSHIIFNSTTLDCRKKFRDFWRSGRALRRLNDRICLEHGYPIIENPRSGRDSKTTWVRDGKPPTHQDLLYTSIDEALEEMPRDFDTFLKLMAEKGFTYKPGKLPGFIHKDWKRSTRLRSLGDGYSTDDISAAIAGKRKHTPYVKKSRSIAEQPRKMSMLIDIQAKLQEGKGGGYAHWAKSFNLKQMAQTMSFLEDNNLMEYDTLCEKTEAATSRYRELSQEIKSAESRVGDIAEMKSHIINYSKTREVYAAYRRSGYSKKYIAEHEGDIILHRAAKKYFDGQKLTKLPSVKNLNTEYGQLIAQKKLAYTEYKKVRTEMQNALIAKANVEKILGKAPERSAQQKEHGQR